MALRRRSHWECGFDQGHAGPSGVEESPADPLIANVDNQKMASEEMLYNAVHHVRYAKHIIAILCTAGLSLQSRLKTSLPPLRISELSRLDSSVIITSSTLPHASIILRSVSGGADIILPPVGDWQARHRFGVVA